MTETLFPMFLLLGGGVLWRALKPMAMDADILRRALTALVYILLLPALVLEVLWKAPLSLDSLRIAIAATVGTLVTASAAYFVFRALKVSPQIRGALILASAWANVTYLGLPVLEALYGPWARSVALQYDLFSNTPMLLSLGAWIAIRHGNARGEPPLKALLGVPALWAAAIAIGLNLNEAPIPDWLNQLLELLGRSVPPLMLIALGLGLRLDVLRWNRLPLLLPVIVIQLFLMPLVVGLTGFGVGLSGLTLSAVLLEAAMPSMLLGIVLCDRYGLDTSLFAAAVSLTTGLSLLTLPLWHGWANSAALASWFGT